MNIYDQICLYDESDLSENYLTKFSKYFNLRGFAYWSWKPEVILQTLYKMNDGDILQYTDMGCHLNYKGNNRLKDYLTKTSESENGFLVFQMKSQPEYQWTKSSVFHFFDIRGEESIINSDQVIGTVFFIKKCSKSMKILEYWLNLVYTNFELFDDSDSHFHDFDDFKEHRHDQSVFSVISKINGFSIISADEVWQKDWNKLDLFPIQAKRDKEIMNKDSIKKRIKAYLPYYIINSYLSITNKIFRN